MSCKWRDAAHHLAKVIDRKQLPGSDAFEYYMHFVGCASSPPKIECHAFVKLHYGVCWRSQPANG